MDAAPIVALIALACGLTALAVSLAWFTVLHRERMQHEATYVDLLNERMKRVLADRPMP